MIIFVVTFAHAYTLKRYLDSWGIGLRSRVKILYYEDIFRCRSLPRGTYIFTDLERLSPEQMRHSVILSSHLIRQGVFVLNRPEAALLRYDLLQLLYRNGVNTFRAFRLPEIDSSLRFPVFLRREQEHDGPISAPLHSEQELSTALRSTVISGATPDTLLVVEYCDTAGEDGLYRKYSAFLIGDRFLPRHLLFSRDWVTKYPDLADERKAEEEERYLFNSPHPHEEQIRVIFRSACINYGRIDYACRGSRILVWEINTNPTIATPLNHTDPSRVRLLEEVAARLRAAFEELADDPVSSSGAPLSITKELRNELGVTPLETLKTPLRQGARSLRFWNRKK